MIDVAKPQVSCLLLDCKQGYFGGLLGQVAALDPGQPTLADQLVEFVLNVDLAVARAQRAEHPGNVTHADHAEQLPVLDHRQVPDPARGHLPRRHVQRHVRRHRERVDGHRLVHGGPVRIGAQRDGPQHVPFGDDPGQPAVGGDEQRAGLLPPHALGGRTELVGGRLGGRRLCHHVPDLHRATLLLPCRWPPSLRCPIARARARRRPVKLGRGTCPWCATRGTGPDSSGDRATAS